MGLQGFSSVPSSGERGLGLKQTDIDNKQRQIGHAHAHTHAPSTNPPLTHAQSHAGLRRGPLLQKVSGRASSAPRYAENKRQGSDSASSEQYLFAAPSTQVQRSYADVLLLWSAFRETLPAPLASPSQERQSKDRWRRHSREARPLAEYLLEREGWRSALEGRGESAPHFVPTAPEARFVREAGGGGIGEGGGQISLNVADSIEQIQRKVVVPSFAAPPSPTLFRPLIAVPWAPSRNQTNERLLRAARRPLPCDGRLV